MDNDVGGDEPVISPVDAMSTISSSPPLAVVAAALSVIIWRPISLARVVNSVIPLRT
jgi:hypothetical protein